METKTDLNDPCYKTNYENKSIETTLKVGEHVLTIKQRRLTGGEREEYKNNLQDISLDPDVYKYLLAQNDIDKQLEAAKKKKKKTKDEAIEIKLSDETNYIVLKGKRAVIKQNRYTQAKLIAYSCNESFSFGGYFKVDGENVSEAKKLMIINELTEDENGIDQFELLFENANKLMNPTEQEKEEAKP